MTTFKEEFAESYDREQLIIKQQEEIVRLTLEKEEAAEKQKRAESKIKRMAAELFSKKSLPFRFERMIKILNENEGRRMRGDVTPPKKRVLPYKNNHQRQESGY